MSHSSNHEVNLIYHIVCVQIWTSLAREFVQARVADSVAVGGRGCCISNVYSTNFGQINQSRLSKFHNISWHRYITEKLQSATVNLEIKIVTKYIKSYPGLLFCTILEQDLNYCLIVIYLLKQVSIFFLMSQMDLSNEIIRYWLILTNLCFRSFSDIRETRAMAGSCSQLCFKK